MASLKEGSTGGARPTKYQERPVDLPVAHSIDMVNAGSKELLRRYGLRARKALGQHFLTDRLVLTKILDAAKLGPHDLVVEVGPGLGVLTEGLARRAGHVVAVEVDQGLASLLRQELYQYSNLTIVNANILDLEPGELLRRHGLEELARQGNYKVVANLPYYIAAPVLRHFLEASHKPSTLVVMVQKEVGETIVATPGHMGLLSLSVQVYGRPSIVARVPSQSFHPRPKVDSVVVAIDVYPEPEVTDIDTFFQVAKAGFSAPRKQLHNSLAQGLDMPVQRVRDLLDSLNVDGRRRPSTLTLKEWDSLCQVFP